MEKGYSTVIDKDLYKKFCLSLGLTRKVVGVKFIFLPEEYDDLEVDEPDRKGTFCALTGKAMKGSTTKAKLDYFICNGGPEMFGMMPICSYVDSCKQYSKYKLYKDAAIARQVQEDLCKINQKIYGVLVGPIDEMEDADVVMFLCNGWQIMRVVHGYGYRNGMPKNMSTIGVQGICSDLVSRPYVCNDINISAMCIGARANTGADDGEMGVGMPIHIFEELMEGVLKTVNPGMETRRKKELLERLSDPNELGFEIEMNKTYGSYEKECKYPIEMYKRELF